MFPHLFRPAPHRRPPSPGSAGGSLTRAALRAVAFAALGVLAGATAAPARADVFVDIDNGNKIDGDVPPGEDIRLRFPLAKGAEPRLRLELLGAQKNLPVSFQRTTLYGPDGRVVAVPSESYFQRHRTGVDTLAMRRFQAPATGFYTLVISTNANIATKARGKFTVKRETRIAFSGDESDRDFAVDLQRFEQSRMIVTRVGGTAPLIERYRSPTLVDFKPGQVFQGRNRATSNYITALEPGLYRYTVGFQETPAVGEFQGVIKIRTNPTSGKAQFRVINPPGVPLTVRTLDRFLVAGFAPATPDTGVGIDFDGATILVTAESGGKVVGQRFDLDLAPLAGAPNPTDLATSVDFPPGQTVFGHRLLFANGHHFLGFSSMSGKSLALMKIRPDLVRDSFLSIADDSATTTREFFMASNDFTVSVGQVTASGHKVHLVDTATMIEFGAVDIGGGALTHSRGAGAAWRGDPGLFEFFAPDTILYGQASDIHHYVFDANWNPSTLADSIPIADPQLEETFPTAVSVDPTSGATVLHYVTPENFLTGAGRIQRVIFDQNGIEIPGSRATLQGTDRHRPASIIVGSYLYVASEGPVGATVERYRLLR